MPRKPRITKTGRTAEENAVVWQQRRDAGESVTQIAKSDGYSDAHVASQTRAPAREFDDTPSSGGSVVSDVMSAVSASAEGEPTSPLPSSNGAPSTQAARVLAWVDEMDRSYPTDDEAHNVAAWVQLNAASAITKREIDALATQIHSRVGDSRFHVDDGREFEVTLGKEVVDYDERLDEAIRARIRDDHSPAQAIEIVGECRATGWKVGELVDAGVSMKDVVTTTQGERSISPDTTLMAVICQWLRQSEPSFMPVDTTGKSEQEIVDDMIDLFDARREITRRAKERVNLIVSDEDERHGRIQVHDLDGRRAGEVTSGNRYTGWQHDEIRRRIALKANGDPHAAADLYLRVSPRKYKLKGLAAHQIDASNYQTRVPGEVRVRELTDA